MPEHPDVLGKVGARSAKVSYHHFDDNIAAQCDAMLSPK
jgi:hypothetical protein